ncbi:hypothetical protein GOP47_0027502 [Adiantum capillus-veneris]|nr:hypothetical protein GOP47_0027502 [Adiantum capillus-veneris]
MYVIGASRSRFKLCRLALCMSRFSQPFANSEKAIIDVADQSGPNLGFCTNPSTNIVNLTINTVSNPQSTTNPSSCTAPAGSDASLPEGGIWAVERLAKGKRFAGHDRMQDRIPGYVFDLSKPELEHVLILVDKFQIQSLWLSMGEGKFLVTVFTLEVFDGYGSQNILYKLPVLPRRINYDKDGDICNIGFVKALPGAKMKLDTPIQILGEDGCIGVKKGAIFVFVQLFV